jgi:hypothetical protein
VPLYIQFQCLLEHLHTHTHTHTQKLIPLHSSGPSFYIILHHFSREPPLTYLSSIQLGHLSQLCGILDPCISPIIYKNYSFISIYVILHLCVCSYKCVYLYWTLSSKRICTVFPESHLISSL